MPSLSDRIKAASPKPSNTGCVTCKWWETISADTRALINEWLDAQHSLSQLHAILTATPDDPDEQPLKVSLTGLRFHIAHHDERCRGPQ